MSVQLAPARRSPPKTLRLDDGRFVMMQLREGSPGAPQVICFPFAGGGPLAFKPLVEQLPSDYTVWAIDLPGHVRTKGDPITTVTAIMRECLRLMPMEMLTTSFFLGYSLGGYVAHALALELEKMGHRIPGVIIAGSTPPSVRDLSAPLSALDDAGQLKWLMSIGQVESSPLQMELYEVFKHAIRGDLKAYDSYRPTAAFTSPALVIGGSQDPMCTPKQFSEWRSLTTEARMEILPGGHFFINTATAAMADIVTAFVDQLTRPVMTQSGEVPTISGVCAVVDDDDTELSLEAYRLIA